MAIEIFIVGGLAVAAAILFATHFPTLTSGIVYGRMILAGFATLAIGAILISTNVASLMVIGALLIFLLALNYATLSSGDPSDVW
jgi:hypothetical protein